MRKMSSFWQKPWTNPFAKCRLFGRFLKLHFSGLKRIFFLFSISKNVFSRRSLIKTKFRFFGLFLKLHFWCLKSIFSIQNITKCFFFAFFNQNKKMRKASIFWQKPWTLQNVYFLDFFRTSLFRSKKHSFLSRILKNLSFSLSLSKINIWENRRVFDKNYGLTPLQNVHFLNFF